MTAFLVDSFTDTATTALQSHTADVGGAWSRHSSSAASDLTIDSTGLRLRTTSASTVAYQNAATPPSADYIVAVDLIRIAAAGSGTHAAGIMARTVSGATACQPQANCTALSTCSVPE